MIRYFTSTPTRINDLLIWHMIATVLVLTVFIFTLHLLCFLKPHTYWLKSLRTNWDRVSTLRRHPLSRWTSKTVMMPSHGKLKACSKWKLNNLWTIIEFSRFNLGHCTLVLSQMPWINRLQHLVTLLGYYYWPLMTHSVIIFLFFYYSDR